MLEPLTSPSSNSNIFHMCFNRDGTTLSGTTSDSCFHFGLDTPETPEKLDYGPKLGGSLVARLGRTSLIAFVSIHSPRTLRILNMSKNIEICSHHYKDSVLAVRLTRLKMVVCLQHKIYIHDSKDMNVEHQHKLTCPNPKGIIAATDGEDQLLLAFPGSDVKGEVHIFDAVSHQTVHIFQAHDQPVACLQFNGSGTLLGSASVEGTYILVFNPRDGCCLHTFYRGLTWADIHNMSFSQDNSFLAVTSNKPTIHVFKLCSDNNNDAKLCDENHTTTTTATKTATDMNMLSSLHRDRSELEEGNSTNNDNYYFMSSLSSWIGWAKSSIAPMLPTYISDSLFGTNGAFATIRMPCSDVKTITAIITSYAEDGPEPRIIVATYDGYIYIFKLNKYMGGECELIKQIELQI